MTPERADQGVVQAVVIHNGSLLLVGRGPDSRTLPSGLPEPAESAEACAARSVYELTGYLVDGSRPLQPYADTDAPSAVVCQLLTEDPSDGARLPPDEIHWVPVAAAVSAADGLSGTVRHYLEGHTPV
ncbi:NUDIX domain-containing protein [Streptomyces sp. NPDC058067]|uniref:NUDIX domain-containing protein n=1 Tax=Streptomyces antnestii TaxID=2494256 RepID=A0A3S2W062_9ACTN|nr:NUDIX domain-containing protein [Streptomyces sp. San01]RVU27926.1 NUDIX domain-containing protein [Streptomyces sp. San01]